MKVVIVTRHPALVEYLHEIGIAPEGATVLTHASPADIEGTHVIGVLPLSLAALCSKVTEVPLALTPEMRGKELSLDEVRAIASAPVSYEVKVVT